MPKKKPLKGKPEVNKELEGMDIRVNEFGEIVGDFDIDKINAFLNENVDDKKLRDRDKIKKKKKYNKEEETDDKKE